MSQSLTSLWARCALGASLLVVLSVASSGTLEDFKSAEGESNECNSIPYSSVRDRCRSKYTDVKDYCGGEQTSCGNMNTYARTQDLDRTKKKIEDLNKTRDDLRRQKDSAADDSAKRSIDEEIRATESAIDGAKREVDDFSQKISDYKYRATGLVERAKRCREARIDVVEVFDEATQKAKSESDPEVQKIAARLIARWNGSETVRGHTIQIKETQEKLLTCEKAARGDQF